MTNTTKPRRPFTCGFCDTNRHDKCPGQLRNGDGSLITCSCTVTDNCGHERCTRCYATEGVAEGYCISDCPALRLPDMPDTSDTITTRNKKNTHPTKEKNMATAKTKKAPATASTDKGTSWLAENVNKATGGNYTPYQLRILLRKLAKDGRIERPEGRWSFSGLKDPNYLALVKAVKAGELDATKKEGTAKAKKATPAKKAPARRRKAAEEEAPEDDVVEKVQRRRSTRRKAADPAPAEEPTTDDLDDDVDELDLEIDEG